MEKDSPFGFDQGGNPTYSEPRAPVAQAVYPRDHAIPPALETASPMVQHPPGSDEHAVLLAAAQLNEPRVREALALIAAAKKQNEDSDAPSFLVEESLAAASFAIAGLLPPANIRISAKLANLISKSGRKAA